MDLIRRILVAVEALPAGARAGLTSLPDCEPEVFAGHVELMEEMGLVDATVAHAWGSVPVRADVIRLKAPGHDLLDAIRSDTVWTKTKSKLGDTLATVSIEVVKAVAVAVSTKSLGL